MRGKGLGKHVMQLVQQIATKLGMSLVFFNLMKSNAKALQQIQQQQPLLGQPKPVPVH